MYKASMLVSEPPNTLPNRGSSEASAKVSTGGSAGVEMPVKPGDHVVFPIEAGPLVEVDAGRLLVCRVVELLAVLEATCIIHASSPDFIPYYFLRFTTSL